jgi:hypothetical protein
MFRQNRQGRYFGQFADGIIHDVNLCFRWGAGMNKRMQQNHIFDDRRDFLKLFGSGAEATFTCRDRPFSDANTHCRRYLNRRGLFGRTNPSTLN